MKIQKRVFLSLLFVLMFSLNVLAIDYEPVVSIDWLEKNLSDPKVVVIDIRKAEDYKKAHIPNSVNVFYNSWAVEKSGRKNELPEIDDLQDVITNAGINNDSIVVIAGISDTPADLASMTRVAWTPSYAGFEKVSVLDGGYSTWEKKGKAVTAEIKKVAPGNFKVKVNKNIYASMDDVKKFIGKNTIVDARLPEAFFGVSKLDFVARAGHIESAVNLPFAWFYTKEGVFKAKEEMAAIAKGVVGSEKNKEMIVYCDTGKVASAGWFVLKKVLGYENVKLYDGSAEEWSKDQTLPMIKYSWK